MSVRPRTGRRGCGAAARRGRHDPLGVRREHREVGDAPGGEPAAVGEPDEVRRRRRHPPDDGRQGDAALAGGGPDDGQPQLDGRDPAPGRAEVALVEALELGGARRVVRHDAVDRAVEQPPPQGVLLGAVADRRAALERRVAVGDLVRGEREVVRARLDGDPGADGLRARTSARPAAEDRCTTWTRAPARAAASATVRTADASADGGREATNSANDGPPSCGVSPSPSSACTRSRPSMRASSVSASRRPAASSGGNSGTPESSRKHLTPKTPRRAAGRAGRRSRDGTAPEPHVDDALPLRRSALDRQGVRVHRRGDAVERHVDDRRDPAGRGGPRRGGETLPLRPAGFVDVDVRVHEPGSSTSSVPGRPPARAVPDVVPGLDPTIRPSEIPSDTARSVPSTTARSARTTRSTTDRSSHVVDCSHTRSADIGNARNRTPTASRTAFASAAATGLYGASLIDFAPSGPTVSYVSANSTSVSGTSSRRGT